MGSESPQRPLVSVVTTVKNEQRHLPRLLESLLAQEEPFEVIVVDALSRDRTYAIAERFAREHPSRFRVVRRFGSRGMGRNAGVELAQGEFIAFIDGDCFADSQWLHSLRAALGASDVVAGKTVVVGNSVYGDLERVELFQRGSDVTFPSCNLAYRRSLFESLGGFDPRFVTAEDIDLNLRAVERGIRPEYVPSALVYHQMRTTLLRFLYQAFWNGYGRKQLTEKHGSLWSSYRVSRLFENQRKRPVAWLRLAAALGGYATRVMTGSGERLSRAPHERAQLSTA